MSTSYFTRLSFPGFLSLMNVGNSCFMNVAALAMKHAPIRMWPCPGADESGMVALLRSLRRGIPVDRDALELARAEIGADSGTLFKGSGQHCALELLYFMADRLEATQQLVGSLEVILLSPSDKSSFGPSFLGLHERCEAGNVFSPRAAVGFGPKTLLCSIDRQIGGGGKDTVSPRFVRESVRACVRRRERGGGVVSGRDERGVQSYVCAYQIVTVDLPVLQSHQSYDVSARSTFAGADVAAAWRTILNENSTSGELHMLIVWRCRCMCCCSHWCDACLRGTMMA